MKRAILMLAGALLCAGAANQQSFHLQSNTIAWKPMSLPGVPNGLQQRLLHENKKNSLMSALVKFPKGFREPRHYHTTCGHSMYILKGRLKSPEAEYTPGSFIYAAVHERHGPFTALEETEFIFYTDGPFDFHVEDKK